MNFRDILNKFRTESFTEKEKGTKFERLMRSWLLTDPRYCNLTDVWMWEDFPGRKDFGGKDTGIDLVARTDIGDYWAIQCKCYAEDATISKPAVDSFLATSSRTFKDDLTLQTTKFAQRIWICTCLNWGVNAEETIQNQDPPVFRINLGDLDMSPVDWDALLAGMEGKKALLKGKNPMDHQLRAVSAAEAHFAKNHRGKMIMACGTGKTYTSLLIAEQMLKGKGLVLFMVPSIALLGQTLNAWAADAKKPIKAVCICSDSKASRKKDDSDDTNESVVDLALPASTDAKSICKQLQAYRTFDGLTVVFSTYQSIDAVSDAQSMLLDLTDGDYGVFDLIICDEAHRTTGVKIASEDESSFTKIHDDGNVAGVKRLYMTATPRLYGENAKIKASEKDCILCSMDDEAIYGTEFFRVNFSYAVEHGLLTDYKVLVLTVDESDVQENIRELITDPTKTQYNIDDTTKLIGVISGLSKLIEGDEGQTWNADPRMMRRAVAFCSTTGKTGKSKGKPGTSTVVADTLPIISQRLDEGAPQEDLDRTVSVQARHIDGSMNSQQRNEILNWLAADSVNPRECRVVTNVRCLSEGVDVPSLDAVLFLSARNSQVDVVQSVGRVMRNFHKGKDDEKKYGYIIIPIVVPSNVKAEDALDNDKNFDVVWDILNALRSHDDRFNATVQQLSLNKNKKDNGSITVAHTGIGQRDGGDRQNEADAQLLDRAEVNRQLSLRFGELQEGIYAKLVEKCGDRLYWENWSTETARIAKNYIARIHRMVEEGDHKKDFDDFLHGLQQNLNPSVDADQAIEMLAQHLITQPVFDALFSDYKFVSNNTISRSMQHMVEVLHDGAFEKDADVLKDFYESVKMTVGSIDNLEGKQTIIKTLYERFFKTAFPQTVNRLGIVYTPVECVDFIIRSVDDLLKQEFNTSLAAENVHILDPFTGTGTFITRLLQSGLIPDKDLRRKYLNEIHCNELVLLAYYIADVNIEAVYHDLMKEDEYQPYDGICLTDTFQLAEPKHNVLFTEYFQANSERVEKLQKTPVRVIIGNPPYSIGQKSANDDAQNLVYPSLDARIANTYAIGSAANLSKSLYDSYIKAFRWASDRIPANEGGIIAFISNGSWLDGNSTDGFRRCIEREFSSIYVLNLRGNARTQGEQRRKEGGGVFAEGSRTPVTITFLVKNPSKMTGKATIYYHDIGDYLTREQKINLVKDFKTINSPSLNWEIIQPNEKADWINQRGDNFDTLIPLWPDKKFDIRSHSYFSTNAIGVATNRDSWVVNFSSSKVVATVKRLLNNYDKERSLKYTNPDYVFSKDETFINWTVNLLKNAADNKKISFAEHAVKLYTYRPFCIQNIYYDRSLIERPGIWKNLLVEETISNPSIGVSGIGQQKPFSVFFTDSISDLQVLDKAQYFPLYWYEEKQNRQTTLFDVVDNSSNFIRHDGVTDWILKEARTRYNAGKELTKEHIFYYVYGILHSKDYREAFEDDLKKSLPRIPLVEKLDDFIAFYKAGKQLAELHLNYEKVPAHPDVIVRSADYVESPTYDAYTHHKVDKMRFGKKVVDLAEGAKLKPADLVDKTTIIYNGNIRLEDIPLKAYDYVVNGKSAIEWIMERYQVTIDTKSHIKNDPNDWSREHQNPTYILDLLLSVINVSCQTVDIVNSLPKLKL